MTLDKLLNTLGFEVVEWKNVEPVGGILGGYFDL